MNKFFLMSALMFFQPSTLALTRMMQSSLLRLKLIQLMVDELRLGFNEFTGNAEVRQGSSTYDSSTYSSPN